MSWLVCVERHRRGPRLRVLGHRVHHWHCGIALLAIGARLVWARLVWRDRGDLLDAVLDVDLAAGGISVGDAKTDAGVRTVDLWPELRDELATYKASLGRLPAPTELVFGTSTGKPDTRQNVRKRRLRAVDRANAALAAEDLPGLPERVTPHTLRRTFAALLYLRGEDPVYVMEQLGHADPKLALRIYAKVIGDRRRRGRGERLVAVLRGVEFADATGAGYSADRTAAVGTGRDAISGLVRT